MNGMKLRVERNSMEIFSKTFEPSYEELKPNGAFCDPTCYSAMETFTF